MYPPPNSIKQSSNNSNEEITPLLRSSSTDEEAGHVQTLAEDDVSQTKKIIEHLIGANETNYYGIRMANLYWFTEISERFMMLLRKKNIVDPSFLNKEAYRTFFRFLHANIKALAGSSAFLASKLLPLPSSPDTASILQKSVLQTTCMIPADVVVIAIFFVFKTLLEKNANPAEKQQLKTLLKNELLNFIAAISSNFIYLNYYYHIFNIIKNNEGEYPNAILAIFGSVVTIILTTYTSSFLPNIIRYIFAQLKRLQALCRKQPHSDTNQHRPRLNGVGFISRHNRPALTMPSRHNSENSVFFSEEQAIVKKSAKLITQKIDLDGLFYILLITAAFYYLSFDEQAKKYGSGWIGQNIMASLLSIIAVLFSCFWQQL
jgi:hypothetical protein